MNSGSKTTDTRALLKDAYRELRKMQEDLDAIERAKTEPIAIIGIGCRFPGGANDPESFWQLLRNGIHAITEVPADRWDIDAYYDPIPGTPGKMYTRSGGFLQQVDQFDPQFFGISPREAVSLDPQQRLLLEVSWEALENAGQAPAQLAGSKTGVFVGIGQNDYAHLQMISGDPTRITRYDGTGNGFCFASGRLSYVLGLQGPNIALDTACSSSLVALHLACQSLRQGECNLALTGGVQLILSPEVFIFLSRTHALASDGCCKTFDATADGFGRGEGCGMLVLKRLSDAVADHDSILALIRGSAINHDGPSSGLTVPNRKAQEELIRQALKNARVETSLVSYIEAHGTGTELGDPIEIRALTNVMMEGRLKDRALMIGSVKTNIGHLEAAAGVAGVIKVVLALQHQEIPPHLHFTHPTPHIAWDELPIAVPTGPTPWYSIGNRRLAGISAFGLSGTNAHVVVEEAPSDLRLMIDDLRLEDTVQIDNQQSTDRPLHLFTLSAKSGEALKELAARYEHHLIANPDLAIGDVCFTANTGRSHFPQRLAALVTSTDDMREKLAAFAAEEGAAGVLTGQVSGMKQPKIVFLFTGQGSQYVDMGHELYDTQPTFRQTLDRCNEILRPYLEISLLEVLYPDLYKSEIRNPKSEIDMTAYTQPALFALEYALTELWKSWGITPSVVIGHSVGEYVAAYVAGVFSLEDGLKLIAERGRLMQTLPQNGLMVAVFADEATVSKAIQPYLDEVSLAAINGPKSVVISGKQEALEEILGNLQAEGIKTKPLTVSHAFHSPLMGPILEEFERVAREMTFFSPQIDLISNVSGQLAQDEVTTPEYWCQHIRQPVRFAAGMETLFEQGYEVFLEIGPKPILLGLGRQIHSTLDTRHSKLNNHQSSIINHQSSILWLPSLRQRQSDWQQLLQSLGKLYVRGTQVDWVGFDREYPRYRVALPTYPFQRQRYWVEQPEKKEQGTDILSQENVQTPLITLLNQGDIEQLAQFLEKAGKFSEEQRRVLPDLLEVFAKQYQQQVTAASVKDWFYQIEWQPRSRQSKTITGELLAHKSGRWLIFADQGGLGQTLAELLQECHQNCLLVYAGDTYKALNPGVWSLNPASPEDFERLFHEILEMGELPLRGVIHLWSLEAAASDELTVASLEQAQMWGCGSILYLVQTIARYNEGVPPRLWLVTRGAVAVRDHPVPLSVAQAPLWGLGRVVGLEYPEFLGGMFDLDTETTDDEAKTLLAELWDSEGEDQFAFRAGQRYVARLVRSRLPELQASPLQPEATYLITGGLGALGLQVAQWMAERGVRYLVLTGRRGASTNSQKEAVSQLEQAGVKVLVAQADVSKEEDIVKVLAEVKTPMPPLKGIVHAAGVSGYQAIENMDINTFETVLRPKVTGTWILHQLTREMNLDFFVSFSSIASVWGSKGQCHYAAANHFLDVLAHYRRALGLPALSVNWGPWAGGGMVSAGTQAFLTKMGVEILPSEQAIAALGFLLGTACIQITVAKVDWNIFKELYEIRRERPLLEEIVVQPQETTMQPPEQSAEILQRLKEAPESDRYSFLIDYMQNQVAKALGFSVSQIDVQQPLNNIGLDSLMAIELRNRVKTDLEVEVPMVKFMEGLSVSNLATQVIEQLTEPIQAEHLVDQIDLSKGVDPEHAEQILAKLDEIDDKKVEELLRAMLSEKEP